MKKSAAAIDATEFLSEAVRSMIKFPFVGTPDHPATDAGAFARRVPNRERRGITLFRVRRLGVFAKPPVIFTDQMETSPSTKMQSRPDAFAA